MQPCGIAHAKKKCLSFLLNIKITFGKAKQASNLFFESLKNKMDFGDVEGEEKSHGKNFSEGTKTFQRKLQVFQIAKEKVGVSWLLNIKQNT